MRNKIVPVALSLLAATLLNVSLSLQMQKDSAPLVRVDGKKFIPCPNIQNTIPMVNNNSVSTAAPDGKYLLMAVAAKNALIYRFPISNSSTGGYSSHKVQPFQVLKDCTDTSAVSLSSNGMHLAVGCANSHTNIYILSQGQYILKQGIKDSYYKNGARVVLSADGSYLFTIPSAKQVNVYTMGANFYQLMQELPVTLEDLTKFSLTLDSRYFAVIQRNSTTELLTVFRQNLETGRYFQLAHPQTLTQIVFDLSMNGKYISVVLGTIASSCSTLLYRISDSGLEFGLFQQIFQPTKNLCIKGSFLTHRNQLVLSNPYFTSLVYQLGADQFEKAYELYHEAQGEPVHSELRLPDTKHEHFILYTGTEVNLFCPVYET